MPAFDHLLRLSDDTGLLEHANGATPRREHGYCLDDVARGLVVLAREPDPPAALRQLLERYMAFTAHAQGSSGAFRNRLGYDRRWQDLPDTGDWWGRALWGLGTVAVRATTPRLRAEALAAFALGATQRSRWPRAIAFATLGAAEVLSRYPDHDSARGLMKVAAGLLGRLGTDRGWPWPEPRLGYANAALAEALIVVGHHEHDDTLADDGLRLLRWLLHTETRDDHLSLVPTRGWRSPEPRPAYDQQPIEAAALADACATAWALTADRRWIAGLRRSIEWFTGGNDHGVSMMDPDTGGGFDGLTDTAVNTNQGAESTLALLSTLQHAQNLDGDLLDSATFMNE